MLCDSYHCSISRKTGPPLAPSYPSQVWFKVHSLCNERAPLPKRRRRPKTAMPHEKRRFLNDNRVQELPCGGGAYTEAGHKRCARYAAHGAVATLQTEAHPNRISEESP